MNKYAMLRCAIDWAEEHRIEITAINMEREGVRVFYMKGDREMGTTLTFSLIVAKVDDEDYTGTWEGR